MSGKEPESPPPPVAVVAKDGETALIAPQDYQPLFHKNIDCDATRSLEPHNNNMCKDNNNDNNNNNNNNNRNRSTSRGKKIRSSPAHIEIQKIRRNSAQIKRSSRAASATSQRRRKSSTKMKQIINNNQINNNNDENNNNNNNNNNRRQRSISNINVRNQPRRSASAKQQQLVARQVSVERKRSIEILKQKKMEMIAPKDDAQRGQQPQPDRSASPPKKGYTMLIAPADYIPIYKGSR